MSRTRVKMCGITRLQDAELAARLGADFIGFVFWPRSPRAISAAAAAAIAHALPAGVECVGVFVDQAPDEVAAIVRQVGLHVVQLHGEERAFEFSAVGARVFKAVTLQSEQDVADAQALPADITPLVDAFDRERRGGTGQLAHWARAAELARARPIILAGGLNAENVGDALATVRPWAVDVSSGIEVSPGIKSVARMRQFVEAVRAQAGEVV